MNRTKDFRPSKVSEKLDKEIARVKDKGPRKVVINEEGDLATKSKAKDAWNPEVVFIKEKKSVGASLAFHELAEKSEENWGAVLIFNDKIHEAIPVPFDVIPYVEWNSELSLVRQMVEAAAKE